MAYCPTPILIVSASINRGELFKTYDALAAGAVEVLDKAKTTESGAYWERKLIDTVKLVSRIRVITQENRKLPNLTPLRRRARSSAGPEWAPPKSCLTCARQQ